ncbi:hypothetical protein HYDPIDRAFT_104826, partial [Hydnomerulius pinastri MD-312]
MASRTNSSLFKSMFSLLSKDRLVGNDKSNGLIAPPSPNPIRRATSPVPPSPTSPMHSPFLPPPPRSPRVVSYTSQSDGDNLSPQHIQLGSPPRRSPQVIRRATADGRTAMTLSPRQMSSSGRGFHHD